MDLSEEKVRELAKQVQDPLLKKSVVVRDVTFKEGYVGLKVALAKTETAEQMDIQKELVKIIKDAGAEMVGLRFEQLADSELSEEDREAINPPTPTMLSEDNKTHFIAVASGKGGVGKSTVSANLAVALSRLGKKVGLIDADIYGFSIPPMMGLTARPKVVESRIIPPEKDGIQIMSMAFFSEDNSPVLWRGPMLGKMLNNFFTEVDWGDLDYLILDLPPGTGDIALDVHRLLPSTKEIIVTTPHETAAHVALRAGKMAKSSNHEILGIVENMSHYKNHATGENEYIFGRGGGERLVKELGTDLLGQLPISQPKSDGSQISSSIYSEDDPIGKVYTEIAQQTINKVESKQHS